MIGSYNFCDNNYQEKSVCILLPLLWSGLGQDTEARNQTLEAQLNDLEQRLESIQLERETYRKNLRSLLELLDGKIFELTELRDTLVKLIEAS